MSEGLFRMAVTQVLKHEGGFTDDQDDPGGATKFGISLRFLRSLGELGGDIDGDGDVDIDDVQGLTSEASAELYKKRFWDPYGYADFADGELAIKAFDLTVNMGPKGSHKCLQRALRAVGRSVKADGILGPKTRQAVADAFGRGLVVAYRSEAAGYYRELVARRPLSKKYLEGWLNRAYS